MLREVVLDANVIVAHLDGADALASRAADLTRRLREDGASPVLLDVLVGEAVSVLCRRARERSSRTIELSLVVRAVRTWANAGQLRWIAGESERLLETVLNVVEETGGRLNFNDGLLVALQREGAIGELASFDRGFDLVKDFRRIE